MNIEQLETRLTILETRMAKMEAGKVAPEAKTPVASASDLDGTFGNPVVKYDLKEKYYVGPSFIGKKFSECSPEYLDATAKYYGACAYMARKGGEEKKAGYKELDASRAAGWAARIRGGYVANKTTAQASDYYEQTDTNDESLPF